MHDIYVVIRDGKPDYAGTHLRTFKTLDGAYVCAKTLCKYHPNSHVQIVQMIHGDTIELEDDSE